jgi:hypothetical protein
MCEVRACGLIAPPHLIFAAEPSLGALSPHGSLGAVFGATPSTSMFVAALKAAGLYDQIALPIFHGTIFMPFDDVSHPQALGAWTRPWPKPL